MEKVKFFVQIVQLFRDAGFTVSSFNIYFVIPEGNNTRVSSVTPYGKMVYDDFGWQNGREREEIKVLSMKKSTGTD